MKVHIFRILIGALVLLTIPVQPCSAEEIPHTERTKGLVEKLLVKLDSTDIYAARKESEIEAIKAMRREGTDLEDYTFCCDIARQYSNYIADSAIVYFDKAIEIAKRMKDEPLRIDIEFSRARILTAMGFYTEAKESLEKISRKGLEEDLLISYYSAWAALYHGLYSGPDEPKNYKEEYRNQYTLYRDSLLAVANPESEIYLRDMEKKEARAGNFDKARHYNAIRISRNEGAPSKTVATRLYDRFAIAYNYEHKITGEAIDDLLESAIMEVENCNQDIASLLRVESYLIEIDEVKAAKKVSDYYYSTMLKFGSRKRRLEGLGQTMIINYQNLKLLQAKSRQNAEALMMISLLVIVLVFLLLYINTSRNKISRLNEKLQFSGEISKRYVGVVFQLCSTYIKRLEVFRTKVHSSLKKGSVERALELTSPSNDIAAEELKELYHNFDSAFIDIFPEYLQTVNSCLKEEARISPKRTEILTTELRILALIKLGIEDSTKIAELLHCSVKTVYNLRSSLKARLAIPEEQFRRIISEL